VCKDGGKKSEKNIFLILLLKIICAKIYRNAVRAQPFLSGCFSAHYKSNSTTMPLNFKHLAI
jgi:hypothetical protein